MLRAWQVEAAAEVVGCRKVKCGGPCSRRLKVTPKSESFWTWELSLPLQLKPVTGVMGQLLEGGAAL